MNAAANIPHWKAARQRVHFVLEGGAADDSLAKLVHVVLVCVTIASVSCVVLGSVPEYSATYHNAFAWFEVFTVTVFTVEYFLRLWSAPDNIAYFETPAWRARLAYSLTFSAVIDLLSILPLYIGFYIGSDVQVLTVMRMLRFYKVTRYSPGMRSILTALRSEQRALFACGVILLGLVLVTGTAIHVAEYAHSKQHFATIPDGMWFSIVTLATVGFGDIVPESTPGRIIASMTIILGILMVALPVGIISSAFAREIHRRDFVVNWAMLARVPLFAGLHAAEIAKIMPYLRSKTVNTGVMVFRKGDTADSMFFIASGEVEIEIKGKPRLGEGNYFGEMGILGQRQRSASVRATQLTKLLVLDAADYHALVERNPEIGRHVAEVAAKRSGPPPPAPEKPVPSGQV